MGVGVSKPQIQRHVDGIGIAYQGLNGCVLGFVLRSGSPIQPTQPFDQVEMSVSAQDGKCMLAAERRNPNVVGRDRGASLFELTTKLGVPDCGFLAGLEHVADRNHVLEPAHVLRLMLRMGDSKAVFAQGDDRNENPAGAGELFGSPRFSFRNGGESPRVEDQVLSSGSILLNSRSINRVIRAVSLLKCCKLPTSFILAFPWGGDFAPSFSATASLINSRSGTRCSAALALARWKIASGISNVVFIVP